MNEQNVEVTLTTIDNPWNPFTHFDEWYVFDTMKGYNTCSLLSRVTVTSDDLSEPDNDLAIDEGIRFIIEQNPFGVHKIIRSNEPFVFNPPSFNQNEDEKGINENKNE